MTSSNVSNKNGKVPRTTWEEIIEKDDENVEESQQVQIQTICNIKTIIKEEQIQQVKTILDPDKVYWDNKEEMYVHTSLTTQR